MALLLHAYTMAAAQRPLGWGPQAFAVPALPALQGPGVRGPESRDARAEVEMGPAMPAAVAQEETGMGGTAPWGSQTPGRAAPPIPGAGFSSGMGSATHSVTLKSVCLMATTVRLLQPACEPETDLGRWVGDGGGGRMKAEGRTQKSLSYSVTTASHSGELPL